MKAVYYILPLGLLLPLAHALDENSDDISDVYAMYYGITGLDPLAGEDSDGHRNLAGATWGSNPLDPNSTLTPSGSLAVDLYDFSILTAPGKHYQFQGTSDLLIEWINLDMPFYGTGNTEHLATSLPISGTDKFFWRAQLLPDYDEDQDRLTAYEEYLLGTSDTAEDSDGDQVADTDEFLAGLNPNSNIDADDNQLPDDWEQFHAIVDSTAASDGDGITDDAEFIGGTSPSDFFNGDTSFVIEKYDSGIADTVSARVLDEPNGQPVANAPVNFRAVLGEHTLSLDPNGPGQLKVTVRTNTQGVASAYIIR
ncbi:MAG: hypothetical protein ACI8ZW_001290 [Yoonia sp.]|jgi:hypothetical protein